MGNLLLVTTDKDTSERLFHDENILTSHNISTELYSSPSSDTNVKQPIDWIYFRDPFHGEYTHENIKKFHAKIVEMYPDAYFVDQADNIDIVYFEDKYTQYEQLSSYMPETYILGTDFSEPAYDYIVKKRISSRSKDIHFSISELDRSQIENGEYIVQRIIPFEEECRVMCVFGIILPLVLLKSGKTEESKNKVLSAEKISDSLKAYVSEVLDEIQLDFIGLDIVRVGESYTVLEVNRSPQFVRYEELTGINPAKVLIDHLQVL